MKISMKIIAIIILFLLASCMLFGAERLTSFYIQDYTNTLKTIAVQSLVAGKTYKLAPDQVNFWTETNSTGIIAYPNKALVKLYENTKFSMHNCLIEFVPVKTPSLLKLTKSNYTFSLMDGIIDILNDNTESLNSVLAIHTPRVNLLLKPGMFRIIVQDKTTVVIVNKGSLYALNLYDDRRHEVKQNTIGIITTYIPIDGNAYYINKAAITENIMPETDVAKMDLVYQSLTNANNGVLFAVIDDEIIGIKK